MNSNGLPRKAFLFSGFTAVALAACGKIPATTSRLPIAAPGADLFDMMRKAGVIAFWENGKMTALPGSPYAPSSPAPGRRPDDCGVSPDASHGRTTLICNYATPSPAPQPIVNEAFYLAGDGYGMYGSPAPGAGGVVGLQGFGPRGGGAIWAGTSGTNCVGEEATALGQAATTIATYISTNAAKFASDLVFWARSYIAGEILAGEFIGIFLGIAASWEVLAVLGAVGLTIGALWLLYKCLHG